MCRNRAARALRSLLIGLSSLALCFAIGTPQAAAHGGHDHHGHGAHSSGRHLPVEHHGAKHHQRDRHRDHEVRHLGRAHRQHRDPDVMTPAPNGQRSSTRAPEPSPSAVPSSPAVTSPTTPASTHARLRATAVTRPKTTAAAALVVPPAVTSPRRLDPPTLPKAPMSGISLPSPRSATRPAGTVSVDATIKPHRPALPGATAQVALFGLDDSVLLGGVLVLLTLGVAVVVAGASRPRRQR